MFHRQNSKTNLPRYSRHDELKNPPNLSLATLFCNVSRIKVVEKVEDPHAYSRVQAPVAQRQRNRACDLDVKRRKAWETSDVTRTDVCTELILDGVWKSRVHFIYGDDG